MPSRVPKSIGQGADVERSHQVPIAVKVDNEPSKPFALLRILEMFPDFMA